MSRLSALQPADIERPVLDLSGEGLRAILQLMIAGSEDHGGIERYVDAVKLKNAMFQQALGGDAIDELELETFKGLCTFMATVRRRIGNWLNEEAPSQDRMQRGNRSAASVRQAALRERLGQLVESGKLTRAEAGELYETAFGDD